MRVSQPVCFTPVHPSPAVSSFPNPEFAVEATLGCSEVLGVRKELLPPCAALMDPADNLG